MKTDSERITEIEKRLDRMDGKTEAEQEHIGPYRKPLKPTTEYLCVDQWGEIDLCTWEHTFSNRQVLDIGNCYPLSMCETLEKAIKARQYLFENCDALTSQAYASENWFGIFQRLNGFFVLNVIFDRIYLFRTEEKAQAALDHIGQDGAMAIINCGWSL